jgi:hypothetical protein
MSRESLFDNLTLKLGQAAAGFAQTLAAALLALLALLFQIASAVLALAVLVFKTAAGVFQAVVSAILAITPIVLLALFRLACVGVAVAGNALAFVPVWQAFGSDPPALLPAIALSLVPLSFAMLVHAGFGGLAAAGLATFGLGKLLVLAPARVRALAITGILASIVFTIVNQPYSIDVEGGQNEQE